MRQISTHAIIDAVKDSAIRANIELGEDVIHAFEDALNHEESPSADRTFFAKIMIRIEMKIR